MRNTRRRETLIQPSFRIVVLFSCTTNGQSKDRMASEDMDEEGDGDEVASAAHLLQHSMFITSVLVSDGLELTSF